MQIKRLFFLVFLAAAPLAQAQDGSWFSRALRSVDRFLTTPSRVFDTTSVYQLDRARLVFLGTDLIRTGMNMQSEVTPQGSGTQDGAMHVSTSLPGKVYQKVGGGITYGGLQLANTVEIGGTRAQRNKYTRIAFFRPRFGISFQYYTINDHIHGTLTDPALGTPQAFSSDLPARTRNLVADVFYFFNPEGFTYGAVTSRSLIQRRSGGSWLVRASYTQGELQYQLTDGIVLNTSDHVGRYRTGEISVGGGYSFNWVPLHRSPNGRSTRGLRNIVLNATFVPNLSFYNHIHAQAYNYPDLESARTAYMQEHGISEYSDALADEVTAWRLARATEGKTSKSYTAGLPGINLAARAGIGFSWERFFLCSSVVFNRHLLRGTDALNLDEQTRQRYRTQTRGTFFDITAGIQLNYRF